MKMQKLFTIDSELVEKLKGLNASGLINDLLHSHFNYIETDDIGILQRKKDEKSDKVEILNKEIDRITDRILAINNRTKEKDVNKQALTIKVKYREKAEELLKKWQTEEITEKEYWDLIDVNEKEKEAELKGQ